MGSHFNYGQLAGLGQVQGQVCSGQPGEEQVEVQVWSGQAGVLQGRPVCQQIAVGRPSCQPVC